MRPRLLDLFSGAGGAAAGYDRAGFEVVGVDIEPQANYPFEFHQADALDLSYGGHPLCPRVGHRGFAAIHASPPCHDHSAISRQKDGTGHLLEDTLGLVKASGLPWVVENVEGPSVTMDGWYFTLCGSMFGMKVRRHRRFGASFAVLAPGCNHPLQGRPWTITGDGGACDTSHSKKPAARDFWRYMEMPWMEGQPPYGVAQAIPPAYTTFIGEALMRQMSTVGVSGYGGERP
jgi:DNA (cytosine-5)-methyltransferase 1